MTYAHHLACRRALFVDLQLPVERRAGHVDHDAIGRVDLLWDILGELTRFGITRAEGARLVDLPEQSLLDGSPPIERLRDLLAMLRERRQ